MIEDLIKEYLLSYGVLGLWTASLLYEKYKTQKRMEKIIEANTKAINKVLKIK